MTKVSNLSRVVKAWIIVKYLEKMMFAQRNTYFKDLKCFADFLKERSLQYFNISTFPVYHLCTPHQQYW